MYPKDRTLAIDRAHLWHPYTQMKDYAQRDPLVITRGQGVKVYDADGRGYYDAISSWWCNVHGHGHPALARAVARQAKRLDHVLFAGVVHPPAAETVDRLRRRLDPSLNRFFFSDDGSTSVEVALKMAFQYWQNQGVRGRTRFVFLENSYHGDTAGSMSVGGCELYHRLYAPLRFKSFMAPAPHCASCPKRRSEFTWDAEDTGCRLECFAGMEHILRAEKESIAAVIVEPLMQGAAGIRFYPARYLTRLRELTRQLDLVLIFDEVATGFGRLGTWFAHQQADAVPDVLCLSKGLSGGLLPLALTVTREDIYQAFYGDDAAARTFFHGHTYTANPIACAAAAESLRLFEGKGWPGSLAGLIRQFHEALRTWADLDVIGDIRFRGLVGAVDLVASRRRRTPFAPEARAGARAAQAALHEGVLLRPLGDTLYWFLPLAVTARELTDLLRRSRRAVETALSALRREPVGASG